MVAMTLLLFSLRYLFDGSMRPIAKFRGVSFIILPPTISWDRLYDALDDCSLMASPHIIHCKLSRSSSAFQFAYRLRLRAVPFGYVMTRLWVADVKVECLLFYICPCVMRWLSSLTRPSRCDILYYTLPHPASHTILQLLPTPTLGIALRPASSAGDLRHPLD